jgi:hypothetical protein
MRLCRRPASPTHQGPNGGPCLRCTTTSGRISANRRHAQTPKPDFAHVMTRIRQRYSTRSRGWHISIVFDPDPPNVDCACFHPRIFMVRPPQARTALPAPTARRALSGARRARARRAPPAARRPPPAARIDVTACQQDGSPETRRPLRQWTGRIAIPRRGPWLTAAAPGHVRATVPRAPDAPAGGWRWRDSFRSLVPAGA